MSSSVRGHSVGEPGALQALVAALLGIAAVAAAAHRPRPQPVKARS